MYKTFRLYVCTAVLAGLYTSCQAAEIACAFDQMQIDPASVVEPCSQRAANESLPAGDRAEAFYVRGRAFARTRRTALAAQDFDIAIKLVPTRSDIYVSRSTAEFKLGRWNDGWADLNRALTVDPQDARATRALGQAYSNAGDVDQAVSLYDRALTLDPTEPYALLERAELRADQHRSAEALADLSALVAIPPDVINKQGYVDGRGVLTDFHVVALNRRAMLFEQIGDAGSAEKDFDAALLERRSASTLQAKAEYLMRADRRDEALKDLDEAVALDPTDGDAQYARGLALAGLKRFQEGLSAFDMAVEQHSKTLVSRDTIGFDHLMRARMLRALSKTDEAVATVEKAICVSPEVKATTLLALERGGYWSETDVSAKGPAFEAALRACMIDEDCN